MMDSSGRDLQQGLTGGVVCELQATLAQLSYAVPAAEQHANSFGAGTVEAVKQFQIDQGLPSTGKVDAATASALSEVILASTYAVKGTVSSPVSAGVVGLSVQLVDKNVGGDVAITSAQTNAVGTYTISAVISPASLKRRSKTQPDLQAHVSSGKNVLAASIVQYNAPLNVTLDVSLPSSAPGLASEYEALTASLSALYKGQLSALQEGAERQDITFLANKSGWDARAVALAALADQSSQITAPAPAPAPQHQPDAGAAPASARTVSLSPEFYYALFRAGLPADANSLFSTSSQSVQAIWQQAITQGVIPQALSTQIPSAVESYQTLAAANLLTATSLVGVSTLSSMLSVRGLTPPQQTTFSQLYAQYSDDPPTFWANVSKSLGAALTTQLQLDGQLFYLSLNNAPLVSALYAAETAAGDLTSPVDLATRGYYDASKWLPLIGNSIPAQVPVQSVANYAELLAAQVRLSFPTVVAADQVKRGIFPIADTAAVATSVSTFLSNNYTQFAIGAEPVEAFIARNKIAGVDPAVVTQVKRLQRVYQLTPDDQTMAALLQHNLDSAYAITRYDSAGFQRAFKDVLGEDQAASTYARARHIYSAVLNVAIGYLGARQAPNLGGTSSILSSFPSAPSSPAYPVIAYPTLESLFGSLDYCTCDDCRSILSPAAYLVDLLQYLDQPSPTLGYMNPQTALFHRRPDLQYLPLTCENTNTALPYIDLVNETLEYYVANQLSLTNFQGYSTDDTVTSADLLANPQFVNNAAYAKLQSAFFPPPLPFNQPLAQLRLLFLNMGIALPDVMATLRTSNSAAIQSNGSAYTAGDILIERLGISRNEYRIFTDGTLKLTDLYGYPGTDAAALVTLQSITLQDYSRRTGVAYTDLVAILKTQFINPNAVLIERLERLNVPFSTLQTLNANPSTAAAFKAGLPAGLDARAYGGATLTDYDAVVRWVTTPSNFARIMGIITLSIPANSSDECSGSSFKFRYTNGNPLTETDFVKLIRFIRLWQKLGLTIEQTDDILTALYPAVDLPAGANDIVNLPLLNAGFIVTLARMGTLYEVMALLSLTVNEALESLLACWALIGTVGDNALYQQMFGGPTLQREDPGAPIATVAGGPNAGDMFITQINSVSISQIAGPGDTPATIAAKIASQINSTVTVDSTTGLPLNQRIFASSSNGVVSIRAGFTLACAVSAAATETFTQQMISPLSQTGTVAGNITAGDTVTATINTIAIPYKVQTGDTLTSVAANLANAINNTTSPDPYSALPLNSLLVASSSAGIVTVYSINSGAPFALQCSFIQGATGSYIAAAQNPAHQTATVGGTVAAGDVLTTTLNGLSILCTVTTENSPSAVAASIVAVINGTATPDPVSGLPMNRVLHASSNSATVTIAANDPSISFTLTCAATAAAITYTPGAPVAASQTATVAGTFAPGAVLTTTLNGMSLTYAAAAGDTAASIATNVANAINSTATIDPVTNVALNHLVSAAAVNGVITVTAIALTGAFNLTVSVLSGTYIAGVQPPPFTDNGYGDFLADPTQTVFGHEPVLRAAFHLTGAEFTLIANSLQFRSSTPLNLNNISGMFRVGWLAHTLGLSVVEFLLLRQMTGLDPFALLDSASFEAPVTRFIRLVQALSNAGLRPVQALYLLWNQDISGKSSPDVSAITDLAFALRAAFSAVAAQFTIQSDPDGTIAKGLMALVYGNTATDFYFGLLNNTLVSSINYPSANYPQPQPAPLQPVFDASGGELSYDDLGKQLSFAGVMGAQLQASIDAAITANQNVPALHQALADLALANQQMVGPFFATYPELRPLYIAYATSTDPVQQKRTTLLNNFLPSLIQKRNQEQALATVTASAGTDPGFANALLDDATILHAVADPAAPNVNDLTALNQPGLAAQIFFSNNLLGTPDIVLDADPASYAPSTMGLQQIATVAGKVTADDTLTTFINGAAVPYTVLPGDLTVANVAAGIASAISKPGILDPFSGLPLNDVVSATAKAGVVTVQASNSGAGIAVGTLVTPAAPTPAYTAGPQVAASQTATVAGAFAVGDVVITTINTIAIAYMVAASDVSLTILAAHIAAAINASATADPVSGLPLNQVVSASSAADVITINALAFGPDFSLTSATSGGAAQTYTPAAQTNAFQTATLTALLPPNDVVVTTINSVAVQYTVAPGDTTLPALLASVAAAVNANVTVDSVTGKALNTIVKASSAGAVLTLATIPPGLSFNLSCSLSQGAYTLIGQAAILQSAVLTGGITANDVLSTMINGTTVTYTVTGAEASLSAVAANVVAAVNATAALAAIVSVTSIGAILMFRSPGASPFILTCSTSPGAAAGYSTGPQLPAWRATVSGGFSVGDVLTTNINDASVTYTISAGDTTVAAIAAKIATAINTTAASDPQTNLPVTGLVVASSAGGIIIFRSAGPAFVMSCSISAAATEYFTIAGELPARSGAPPLAGIWSGYLDAPQDGFYNLQVETDPGATVALFLDGTAVNMTPSANRSVWNNQSPISLTAGELEAIKLTVTSLQSLLALNWQSAGLGWQAVPPGYLYSDTLTDRLQTTYIRFLKITSLAAALSLTPDEIAFLGTSPGIAVSTQDSTDNFAPGAVVVTPASMANISPGSRLVIDTGATQEIVTVNATTASTFSIVCANPHDGTVVPFPIVNLADAGSGRGWLNLLAVPPIAGSATAGLQPATAYTPGPPTLASQTATIVGPVTTGNMLTTTINGVNTPYTVLATDTSPAILAGSIVAAITANAQPDPNTGLPLNKLVSAASAGAVITITATTFGPDITLNCVFSAGATETYTFGPQTPASQAATLTGILPANEAVVTMVNGVTVTYTVTAADITATLLAAKVAAAINASTTVDPVTNRPLNGLVKASSAAGIITITTVSPGAPLTISCSIAGMTGALTDLLNFSRIKAALSPNDEQLLDVLKNPALLSADGATPQIVKLTGWSASSLSSILQHFFATTQLSSLASIENLRRVFDAFAFVTTSRLSGAALLAATTNAPSPATVTSLQSALRALYAASDWLGVIKPISDAMRIQQRDALVAYILQQLGDQYAASLVTQQTTVDAPAGSTTLTLSTAAGITANMGVQGLNFPPNVTVTAVAGNSVTLSMAVSADVPPGSSVVFAPNTAVNITTADNLFEFFLIDVETGPPVETSRIRLALSSVQLFVERILRNLEPQIMPTDINGLLWTWMKRYRVWQANREVFLWPENWLYPELRDDQSPFFEQMMSALLQSDITDDAAAEAYLDYLSNLELVAKLEPCGLYYVPAASDADKSSYVVARTAGAHRKYYFRQLQYGSWTPWTEIKIDCEDMPITPIVWNGRLLLFWLKIMKSTTPQPVPTTTFSNGQTSGTAVSGLTLDDVQQFGQNGVAQQTNGNVTVSTVLCWSEFYNGKWQPQKSSDPNRPASLGTFDSSGPNSFDVDRDLLQITPVNIASHLAIFKAASAPVDPSFLADALVLGISSPPYKNPAGGFVLYNTHSLPVRWNDITLPINAGVGLSNYPFPLRYLALPPTPGRVYSPAASYTGGSASKDFTISYSTQSNPGSLPATETQAYQNSLFGLNRGQRTVEPAPSPAGWDAPFFYEDRRNVFYVTTTETSTPFSEAPIYGLIPIGAVDTRISPELPPLVLRQPTVSETRPFASGLLPGGGETSAVAQFVAQDGPIRAVLGSTAAIVYHGTELYPAGQDSQGATSQLIQQPVTEK
jgi:hypothetical protein